MNKNSMITLQLISKSYGQNDVLKDVNLTINQGEIYGLVGKNGAGKTTIFKIILGLTDFESGKLSICESKCQSETRANRKRIGFFIGQNFFDYLNARDNLDYYCRMKNIRKKGEVERVLKIVGLDQTKDSFKSFSMGMKQRLGIANALLGNPEILILDEPVNGLDPQGIADVRNLLVQLKEEYGMTIVISSHILSELEHTADRFGIVHEGRILREISHQDLTCKKDTLEIQVDDLNLARTALEKYGVHILGETSKMKSLEDYYFELVGEIK